jgi:hypothetical protein
MHGRIYYYSDISVVIENSNFLIFIVILELLYLFCYQVNSFDEIFVIVLMRFLFYLCPINLLYILLGKGL